MTNYSSPSICFAWRHLCFILIGNFVGNFVGGRMFDKVSDEVSDKEELAAGSAKHILPQGEE
jgi:hypothetical protein